DDLQAVLADVLSDVPGSGVKAAKKPDTVQDTLQAFSGVSPKILLAEDNYVNQQVAVGILKKYGLTADIAANGVEAIKALETIPYALVLMDMRMPLMDGVEATRLIRNPGSSVLNHDVPIIAMTANAMQSDQDLCKAAGMNDFVPKPVQPSVLMKTIQRWLVAEKKEAPALTAAAVVSAP
ncbi:MAG: response regulator, partial [Terracidiphilus sp.]